MTTNLVNANHGGDSFSWYNAHQVQRFLQQIWLIAPYIPRFRCDRAQVIAVNHPLFGIVYDVLPDTVQRFFAAYDVFIVVPLPDRFPRRIAVFIDAFRYSRFE